MLNFTTLHFSKFQVAKLQKKVGLCNTTKKTTPQSTDYRVQITDYRVQITEYRLQSTDNRLQKTERYM